MNSLQEWLEGLCRVVLALMAAVLLVLVWLFGPRWKLFSGSLLDYTAVTVVLLCEPTERVVIVGSNDRSPAVVEQVQLQLEGEQLHVWIRGRALRPWDSHLDTAFRREIPFVGLRNAGVQEAVLHSRIGMTLHEIHFNSVNSRRFVKGTGCPLTTTLRSTTC